MTVLTRATCIAAFPEDGKPPRDFRGLQLLRDGSRDEAYPTVSP